MNLRLTKNKIYTQTFSIFDNFEIMKENLPIVLDVQLWLTYVYNNILFT